MDCGVWEPHGAWLQGCLYKNVEDSVQTLSCSEEGMCSEGEPLGSGLTCCFRWKIPESMFLTKCPCNGNRRLLFF